MFTFLLFGLNTVIVSAQPTVARVPHSITSPDNKFEAVLIGVPKSGNDAHYQIRERKSQRSIFETRAKYPDTPSDVKFASFSVDSQKFAAGYHYRKYTWIGVYWVTTGLLASSWKYDGWIRNFPMSRDVFDPAVGSGTNPQPPSLPPATEQPDLTITGHAPSIAIIHAGEKFRYQVAFANIGNTASGTFVIRFWLDGVHYGDASVPSYNPGQGDLAWAEFPDGLSAGDHTLGVCLDPESQVQEWYENNNCTRYGVNIE